MYDGLQRNGGNERKTAYRSGQRTFISPTSLHEISQMQEYGGNVRKRVRPALLKKRVQSFLAERDVMASTLSNSSYSFAAFGYLMAAFVFIFCEEQMLSISIHRNRSALNGRFFELVLGVYLLG